MPSLVVANAVQADKVLMEQADERDQKRMEKTTGDREYVIKSSNHILY
jgi:hypothetical protein